MFGELATKLTALSAVAIVGALFTAGGALVTDAALAQQGGPKQEAASRIESLKAAAASGVEARRKLAQVINDTVFSFGELAYQEFETSKYLTGLLEKNGFTVERGVAGLPTAWVARWGSGAPVIALGSDIDCLPKASQKPGVAYREPLVEGAPGHGEGHNSGQAVNIVAALAVKELMEREKLPGTLVLWPASPRKASRRQGLHGARRHLQRRRYGAVHPCGRQSRNLVGTAARPRERCLGGIHLRGRLRPCGGGAVGADAMRCAPLN